MMMHMLTVPGSFIPVVFSTCFVWSFLIFTVHTTTTNISFFLVPFIRLHLTMMMHKLIVPVGSIFIPVVFSTYFNWSFVVFAVNFTTTNIRFFLVHKLVNQFFSPPFYNTCFERANIFIIGIFIPVVFSAYFDWSFVVFAVNFTTANIVSHD